MTAPVFATLGCRLNAYETEAMTELAAAAGLENAVIVNTCAVTAEAVRKAVASKDYTDFMTSRGLGVIYGGPDDMAKFMAKSDAEMGVTMKAVGLVK